MWAILVPPPRATEPAQKETKLGIQKSCVTAGEILPTLSLGFLHWGLGVTPLSRCPSKGRAITLFPTYSRRQNDSRPSLKHSQGCSSTRARPPTHPGCKKIPGRGRGRRGDMASSLPLSLGY